MDSVPEYYESVANCKPLGNLPWIQQYIFCVFSTVPCSTPVYQKSNGSYYCDFYIRQSLNWKQAYDTCVANGGNLPEIYSWKENYEILKSKVNIIKFLEFQNLQIMLKGYRRVS
jgi:hypothetical protein